MSIRSGRACKLTAVRGLGLGGDRKSREERASTVAYSRFGSAVVVSKIFTARFRFSRSTRLIQAGWAHDASVVRSGPKGLGEDFFRVAEWNSSAGRLKLLLVCMAWAVRRSGAPRRLATGRLVQGVVSKGLQVQRVPRSVKGGARGAQKLEGA